MSSALGDLAQRVHTQVLSSGDMSELVDKQVIRSMAESLSPLLDEHELDQTVAMVSQQLFGLGPLEPLLADPEITEVMVNGPGRAWIEQGGRLSRTDVVVDANALRLIVDRIVGPLGLRVDRTSPFLDARLADGSRVHIAVPPLAIDGPYVTIRRFRQRPFTLANFSEPPVTQLLERLVTERRSVIVSGSTGSGKTSLLNALAAHVPPSERVITIEDAAELRLPGDHTVRLEARPANAEGVGAVPIRTLVRNALRMRPDRLVLGEVRGAEAFDLVQAMNTGHEGSMSTCHANSPVEALARVQAMALMSDVALPVDMLRQQLMSALDAVIHVERSSGGVRRVDAVYGCGEVGSWLVRNGERCSSTGQVGGERSDRINVGHAHA